MKITITYFSRSLVAAIFLLPTAQGFPQSSGKIIATKTEGCAPFTVSFSSTIQNASSYQWDFGNGTTSSLEKPVVLYDSPGNYPVKLTVTDEDNNAHTLVLAQPIEIVGKPIVEFSISGTRFCAREEIAFTNYSQGASTYLWDFGDGITSREEHPIHYYENPGN